MAELPQIMEDVSLAMKKIVVCSSGMKKLLLIAPTLDSSVWTVTIQIN